jgi:hypothetical protein
MPPRRAPAEEKKIPAKKTKAIKKKVDKEETKGENLAEKKVALSRQNSKNA